MIVAGHKQRQADNARRKDDSRERSEEEASLEAYLGRTRHGKGIALKWTSCAYELYSHAPFKRIARVAGKSVRALRPAKSQGVKSNRPGAQRQRTVSRRAPPRGPVRRACADHCVDEDDIIDGSCVVREAPAEQHRGG